MNTHAMNGEPNPARPFAIGGMSILCLSLLVFFLQFAEAFSQSPIWKRIIQIGAVLSMGSALFIFTEFHDIMTTVSSVFGLFVVIGVIRGIYKSRLVAYKYSGLFCIALLGVNNYIYYSDHFIEYLPLVQKMTFLVVLAWVSGLSRAVNKAKLMSKN